jgi:hypothetical protein
MQVKLLVVAQLMALHSLFWMSSEVRSNEHKH